MGDGIFQPDPPNWESLWVGMPEFVQEDATPHDRCEVLFRTAEDRRRFFELVGERADRKKSIWYPHMDYFKQSERGAGEARVRPGRYPIYVISKGRWESRLTTRALERLGLPHHVVVEPQEARKYRRAARDPESVLVLPFSNLGRGSIPARNWVWEHAVASGAERHWILDDNLDGFYRFNRNLKTRITDWNPFEPVERFTDRFRNVALSGMNYEFFVLRRQVYPPFYLNTRVYSCILINHALPHRWRGRYNEDTDLSLRALKDGWVTVLFNAYLAKKMPTMTMSGGNTDQLYKQDAETDGRRLMAESLLKQHPDVVRITHKWGRWQHHVDYRPFADNRLEPA